MKRTWALTPVNSKSRYTTISECMISQVSTSPSVTGKNDTVRTERDIGNNLLSNLEANALEIFLLRCIFLTQWVNDMSNEAAQLRFGDLPFSHMVHPSLRLPSPSVVLHGCHHMEICKIASVSNR